MSRDYEAERVREELAAAREQAAALRDRCAAVEEQAAETRRAVLDIHRPDRIGGCVGCARTWPCATARALGVEQ